MRHFILTAMLAVFALSINAQDSNKVSPEILELKLQLLDARMQLIDNQLSSLIAIPDMYQHHMLFLDSMMAAQRDSIRTLRHVVREQEQALAPDPVAFPSYTGMIHMDPYRLFEGTLAFGYERMVAPRRSVDATLLGTYVTRGGLGGGYLSQNDFEALDPLSGESYSYNGDMFTGLGLTLMMKNYLGGADNPFRTGPLGLYAGPLALYRHVTIRGIRYVYDGTEYEEKEVTQNLDVFSGGVVVGGKFRVAEVFAVDIYAGGLMRLSSYANESGFTRYKKWSNIDYSGVLPTAGLKIGILR